MAKRKNEDKLRSIIKKLSKKMIPIQTQLLPRLTTPLQLMIPPYPIQPIITLTLRQQHNHHLMSCQCSTVDLVRTFVVNLQQMMSLQKLPFSYSHLLTFSLMGRQKLTIAIFLLIYNTHEVYLHWRNILGTIQWISPIPDFKGVDGNKLLIGVLALTSAGVSNYYGPPQVIKQFKVWLKANNYPLKGFMMWDSNWDKLNNFLISNGITDTN